MPCVRPCEPCEHRRRALQPKLGKIPNERDNVEAQCAFARFTRLTRPYTRPSQPHSQPPTTLSMRWPMQSSPECTIFVIRPPVDRSMGHDAAVCRAMLLCRIGFIAAGASSFYNLLLLLIIVIARLVQPIRERNAALERVFIFGFSRCAR